MDQWTNIWSFSTKRFIVTLDWQHEQEADLSWDDTGEAREKIDAGAWVNCTFRTRVMLDACELATDYLGNSIHADPREFRDHVGLRAKARADGRNYGSYFTDMVRASIADARKAVLNAPKMRS
jgi:hypothetical protein